MNRREETGLKVCWDLQSLSLARILSTAGMDMSFRGLRAHGNTLSECPWQSYNRSNRSDWAGLMGRLILEPNSWKSQAERSNLRRITHICVRGEPTVFRL